MDRYSFLASRIPAFAGLIDDYAKAQVRWISQISPPPGRVLDAGCGAGRHAILLSQLGYDVLGIDASAPALDVAKQQAADHGVDVQWTCGDLREAADGPYDLILVMDVTLGVFDDAEATAVLKGLRKKLKPGGTLILELYHLPFWRTRLGTKTLAKGAAHPDLAVERTYSEDRGYLTDDVVLVSDTHRETAPTQRLRAWSPEEAVAMAATAGLKPVDLLGPKGFEYRDAPSFLGPDAAFFWVVAKR